MKQLRDFKVLALAGLMADSGIFPSLPDPVMPETYSVSPN